MEERMTFDRLQNKAVGDSSFKTFGFFKDEYENNMVVYIREVVRKYIEIKVYTEEGEEVCFMDVFFYPRKRFYLSDIYCKRGYRGRGIAEKVVEMMEYLLKDYRGYSINGVLYPHEYSSDTSALQGTYEDLYARVENFYSRMGFEIISYAEYCKNREEYPLVDERTDFLEHEHIPERIILKRLDKKEFSFIEIDDLVFDEGATDLVDTIKDALSQKKFVIKPDDDHTDKY